MIISKNSSSSFILFFLLFLLLSQSVYAENKTALYQPVFSKNKVLAALDKCNSYFNQLAHQLKEKVNPITGAYAPAPVLDKNDLSSIRKALSLDQGGGAVSVNINPFTPEIAEKIRQAIHVPNRGGNYLAANGLPGLGFNLRIYDKEWTLFKDWLLSKTQIISSEEIDQFRKEVDQFLLEVRQTILKTDGQKTKPKFFVIRTDQILYFTPPHRHTEQEYDRVYISASIAPVGLGTYYELKTPTGKQQKALPRSVHTTIMSEKGRMKVLSESGEPTLHGTPNPVKDRLYLIGLFVREKSD